ncbi:MAG: TIGR03619 family F420-dependent LLM class oxidoreductase [Chloroflexi bacterium]|nr:TIGR03619 family F420-dependent LLM class oxidoreductase [Chloroflexota bacterium]
MSIPVRDLQDDHEGMAQFVREAEELGFTHLRVPDRVAAVGVDHVHEPLTLLAWVAAHTQTIELVPSVIVLPTRQTVVVAKQAAEIDRLSGGRLRFGVGVGARAEDYAAFGQDFHTRGRRCDEQIEILRRLWTEEAVNFEGRWDRLEGERINPLPVQQPIPIWIGGAREPGASVVRRIGAMADGWFALMAADAYGAVREAVSEQAAAAGRDPEGIGSESAVQIVGKSEADWLAEVEAWQETEVTHLCLRTLGAGLDTAGHLEALHGARAALDRL